MISTYMITENVNEIFGYNFAELSKDTKLRLASYIITASLLIVTLLTNFISHEFLRCCIVVYGQAIIACISLQQHNKIIDI